MLALSPLFWPAVGEEPRGGEAIAWVTLIAALLAAGLMWWRLRRRA
jgi:hypothetical protein